MPYLTSRSPPWRGRPWLGSLGSLESDLSTSCLSQDTTCYAPERSTVWAAIPPTFHNSINGRSFLSWEVLRKNHHDLDWLALPISRLMANKNFGEISLIMNNLSVVNDPAERMIRLVTKRGAGQHGVHGDDQPRDLGSGQHRGLGPTQPKAGPRGPWGWPAQGP